MAFHALTLKLPVQTSPVAPELPVSLSPAEYCPKFMKTSTPQILVSTPHTSRGNGQAAS